MDGRRRRIAIGGGLMLLILALIGAGRAEGRILEYRIPVRVEWQEQAADGMTRIGKTGSRSRSAQIRIDPAEARLRNGGTGWTDALGAEGGEIVSARWRLRVSGIRGDGNGRYALWPRGNEKATLTARMEDGWNLWDVRPLIAEAGRSGEPLSLRLMAADGSRSYGADFDLENSWIDVRIRTGDGSRGSPVGEEDLLDSALTALPANHWVLERYRETTEAIVIPAWPETGAPYYFGGHLEENVLRVFTPDQSSSYYREGKYYLGGFDCIGFIRWAQEKAGRTQMASLEEVITDRSAGFPMRGMDPGQWHWMLQPGDLLAFDHGSLHVGIYLGIPRQYGITGENAPELAEWLDAPMMIHCGEDPFVYDRFAEYLRGGETRRVRVTPPDGGVTVSILVNGAEDAPHRRAAPWGREYGYFRVMGQEMTAFPLRECRRIAWTAD